MPLGRRPARRTTWVILAVAAVLLLAAAGVVAGLRALPHGTPSATPTAAAPSSSPAAPPVPTPAATPSQPSPTPPVPARTSPAPTPSASPRPGSTTAPRPTSPAPSGGVPAGLRGQDVAALPTQDHVAALTFDAGGDDAGLPAVLRALAAAHVHATFFLTGRWAAAHPADVAAILAAGHRTGDHTLTHPHLPALPDAAVREEVLGGQRAVLAAGADPRPLFRFPFGDRDARTIALVNGLGYVAVRWTVDTLGWQGTSAGRTAQQVVDRVLSALRPGEIVLMHVGANPDDRSTLDADALPGVIARLRAAGYGFVTLDALTAR